MNDYEFIQAFERCELLPEQFVHRDHIRMAWNYLHDYGWDEGIVKIRDGIVRYATHLNVAQKYHETLTVFWAKVVWNAIQQSPEIDDYELFTVAHPELFDKNLIHEYYSREYVFSDDARHHWVEPDIQPLPMNGTDA